MREPTRFGPFLLLKKLIDDPIGEIYRAGRIDGNEVGELVLLRIFSLPGTDAASFVADLRAARESNAEQQGPGVTHAVECGEVGGVAYAAYEYFICWNLPAVVEKANDGFADLERDYALLIAERIAKGLSGIHQIDPQQAQPSHGFLLPYNVLVSGDGEIRLLGFESGLALAAIAARREAAQPYLSPEVRGGGAPGAADDVYSLGGSLWHLLMGEPPPADIAEGLTTRLASATTTTGEVLPTGLAELLQGSFAAARGRIAQAAIWHQRLTDWMARHEVRTTHFDLAFFIHELFRQHIKKEEEEIAEEKEIDLRTRTGPVPIQVAAPVDSESATETGIGRPQFSGVMDRPEFSGTVARPDLAGVITRPDATTEAPRPSKTGLYATIAAGVLVVLIGLGFVFLAPPKPVTPPPPPPPTVLETPPPPPATEALVTPPSQELELAQQELQRLVEERTSSVGAELAQEYDDQIRQLQEQLREARIAEEEAMRRVAERAAEAREQKAPPPPPPPPPAAEEPAPPAVEALDTEEASVETPSPPPAESPAPASPAPPPAAASPAPPPPPPPPSAAEPPPAASVEIKPPERISMPDPGYPPQARQLRKGATVLVKVLVGTDGRVREAEPVIAKADTYGFQAAALSAARRAVFKPGTADGEPQEMWTTVVISFRY